MKAARYCYLVFARLVNAECVLIYLAGYLSFFAPHVPLLGRLIYGPIVLAYAGFTARQLVRFTRAYWR